MNLNYLNFIKNIDDQKINYLSSDILNTKFRECLLDENDFILTYKNLLFNKIGFSVSDISDRKQQHNSLEDLIAGILLILRRTDVLYKEDYNTIYYENNSDNLINLDLLANLYRDLRLKLINYLTNHIFANLEDKDLFLSDLLNSIYSWRQEIEKMNFLQEHKMLFVDKLMHLYKDTNLVQDNFVDLIDEALNIYTNIDVQSEN